MRAYNPCMFHSLNSLLGRAAIERLTLLANHVIGSEPAAMARLEPHSGRSIRLHFDGWPTLLPPLPDTVFRVTPAGLLEWCGDIAGVDSAQPDADAPAPPLTAADLLLEVDASNPALAMLQSFAGERPKVTVAGDAAFAGDLNWLIDNLRWDVQDDLARIVGQGPAREASRWFGAIAAGLRETVRAVGGIVARR